MQDKQVGELWSKATHKDVPMPIVQQLIRKLVEERAQVIATTSCDYDGCKHEDWKTSHTPEALRDFGIDPKEYK